MSTQFVRGTPCGAPRAGHPVLDALNQAVWQRKPYGAEGLIHHSDRGSQYLSIKYTERLAEAQIDASVGTVGDSYDNARCTAPSQKPSSASSRCRLQGGSHQPPRPVEINARGRVGNSSLGDWYNNRRLLSSPCAAPSDTSHPQKPRRHSMKSQTPMIKLLEI